ncbi:hypothetical protein JOD24_000480 [Kroppenstedtia sanguinis]
MVLQFEIRDAPWALQFEIRDAPWALQSKGAEALDEGSTTGTTISMG